MLLYSMVPEGLQSPAEFAVMVLSSIVPEPLTPQMLSAIALYSIVETEFGPLQTPSLSLFMMLFCSMLDEPNVQMPEKQCVILLLDMATLVEAAV